MPRKLSDFSALPSLSLPLPLFHSPPLSILFPLPFFLRLPPFPFSCFNPSSLFIPFPFLYFFLFPFSSPSHLVKTYSALKSQIKHYLLNRASLFSLKVSHYLAMCAHNTLLFSFITI